MAESSDFCFDGASTKVPLRTDGVEAQGTEYSIARMRYKRSALSTRGKADENPVPVGGFLCGNRLSSTSSQMTEPWRLQHSNHFRRSRQAISPIDRLSPSRSLQKLGEL
ncbi:MAG: hypothetical protein N838_24465 [Thiohalocapsa sp. PB-PSB1]|jgi:hypothetical protein|nr:MAG: hypothetical protein N838_19355 [Thiohalocapsa sp. PB-PSB1]QQO56033.1 MAG: hypothetical protein N838_24465 [Thiohalocapsa sp. PB-PSB1]HCS91956.1 hypothetical protein [Chromatiaceae bacterium]